MPLEPWNTVLNEDPRIVGNEDGNRIFSVSLKNRDAPIPTLLIQADTPEEAEKIFRGDGIAKENELLCVDVTDTVEIHPVVTENRAERIDEFTPFEESHEREPFPATPVDSSEATPKPEPKPKKK